MRYNQILYRLLVATRRGHRPALKPPHLESRQLPEITLSNDGKDGKAEQSLPEPRGVEIFSGSACTSFPRRRSSAASSGPHRNNYSILLTSKKTTFQTISKA